MDPAVAAIISAGVTATLGTVATTLTGGADHRRWLRQQRMEAYARLVALVSEATSATTMQLRELASENDRGEVGDAALNDLVRVSDELWNAAATIMLLGPRRIVDPTIALAGESSVFVFLENNEVNEALPKVNGLLRAFVEAGQKGLRSRR